MKIFALGIFVVSALSACFGVVSEFSAPNAAPSALPTPPANAEKAVRDQNVVPILETNLGGLLGGVKNGEWISAKETAGILKGGEKYKIFGLDAAETFITGEAPENEIPCEEFYSVAVSSKAENGAVALGSQLNWNPRPRSAVKLANNSAIYAKIIGETLASKGLSKSVPNASQIFQIDLDGDGTNEIIISATAFKKGLSSRAEAGDYSFVLLRKVVNGKAENSLLSGDFIAKTEDFSAPAEYKISSIADLNGDGKMEIIIFARYYEGNWVEVFELKNGAATSVEKLKSACGV